MALLVVEPSFVAFLSFLSFLSFLNTNAQNIEMAGRSSQTESADGFTFEMTDQNKSSHHVMNPGEKMINEVADEEVDNDETYEDTKSAPEDALNMQRMGKKQQLIVRLPPSLCGSLLGSMH